MSKSVFNDVDTLREMFRESPQGVTIAPHELSELLEALEDLLEGISQSSVMDVGGYLAVARNKVNRLIAECYSIEEESKLNNETNGETTNE